MSAREDLPFENTHFQGQRFRFRGTFHRGGDRFRRRRSTRTGEMSSYFYRVRARNVAYRFAELRGHWKCHATRGELSKLSSYRVPRERREREHL
jgi:hypothetical protein